MMKINSVILGDCLDVMKDIPNDSIDMVLCDLPYGTTQNKWDSIIPLGNLWSEYNRICKVTSPMVFTAAQPFTSLLINSNIKNFKYDWVWRKPKGTGHLNAKKQPLRDKEDILVFYRKQCTYNPQFLKGKPYKNKAGRDFSSNSSMTESYGKYSNYREVNSGFRYPKQVIDFGVVERGTVHPTQKPVDLFRYLIRTYTNEGDLVLDNACGSGTTGVACLIENRRFLLIEKDENYYNIAAERIKSEKQKNLNDEVA